MISYLLDTDILIDYFNKRPIAIELVEKLALEGKLVTSILSLYELRAGWSKDASKVFLEKLYNLLVVEGLDIKMAELAGEFRYEYKSKGIVLAVIDTLIATTAILGNFQLVTKNVRHFPMPELNLYPLD